MTRVLLLIERSRLSRWHLWLTAALTAIGCAVAIRLDGRTLARARSLGLLIELERLVRGRGAAHATDVVDESLVAACINADDIANDPEIVLDLGGGDTPRPDAALVLTLHFDNSAGEDAMWAALLEHRAPLVAIARSSRERPTPVALPALEQPLALQHSADAVLSRVVDTLALSVRAAQSGTPLIARAAPLDQDSLPRPVPSVVSAAAHLASLVAAKARKRLDFYMGNAPQWAVGWRRTASAKREIPAEFELSRFSRLRCDGKRYYADPFLFRHEGSDFLFVEELPYATGRGIISVATIGTDGRSCLPRPVLERPYHLSYPQVFARDGAIWMLPEASASGGLELYRAEAFPDRWVLAARLIDTAVHDATLFEHDGRLWIAAGSVSHASSSWDGLNLYHSDRLLGPWRPHALNPVLIDARSARPAGELFQGQVGLWRPAQDCTQGYGGALTLARVTTLDPERFEQCAVQTVRMSDAPRCLGPHTWNVAGRLEAIDYFAPSGPARS